MPEIIRIPASKSISNRLLILQALYPALQIENLSTARDTQILQKALRQTTGTVDIADAGTAMRFALAFFALKTKNKITLTGTRRMQERPVKPLAEALIKLGARLEFPSRYGYPPAIVNPARLDRTNTVSIEPSVSSQFISALLLIAPALPQGLQLQFNRQQSVSYPYVNMTLEILKKAGVSVTEKPEGIEVKPAKKLTETSFTVESDWSSASYFYAYTAITGKSVTLGHFEKNSLQGDSIISRLFKNFGVETRWENNRIILQKKQSTLPGQLHFNCKPYPDLAQTLAVTCLALNIPCRLTGLETLHIKETDRVQALKTEMEKLGAKIRATHGKMEIQPPQKLVQTPVEIETYHDHRMTMAFAPLLFVKDNLTIKDRENTVKSFPGFWDIWEKLP